MLEPYTVLDFTDERGEIGPMLLGDLGADVIRVEPPEGTDARACEPLLQGVAGDDLRSLQFIAFNRNKRSIVLDPDSNDDRDALHELIRRADIIIESAPSRTLERYGIDFDEAQALNSRIVFVRVSPFGDSGPHADWHGNDLVVAAMGGPVSLQGVIERAPVRVSVPQVWRHAGAEAAAGAMVALTKALQSGKAQFVDLSAQCAMTWTMLNAMDAFAIQGFDFERSGSIMNTGIRKVELVHPTSDGYIVALPMSKVITGCLDLMIEDGVADESYREVDWEAFDFSLMAPGSHPVSLEEATGLVRKFFAGRTKKELYEFGIERNITLAPVNTLEELLALDHMSIREYWTSLDLPDGQQSRTAGLWCKPSNQQISIRRPAPRLGEHSNEIRAELTEPAPQKSYPEPTGPDDLPFAGLQVADFSWVGVGPISAKYLADHGANVIRIESENRLDVLRGGGPHKDAEPGVNRSQFFGDFNTSKQSITLDMKSPEAIEIAKKLIAKSDVMIESFAPGAIERMGFTYDEVKNINPEIIMISTCLMGQTGPAAKLAGYGYHAAAIAGFYEVTGWPDLMPTGPWVAYTDTIAPRFISTLLAAALDHRRRTGKGCYVDVAQIETALHFLAPELLDLQSNGRAATRIGNRSAYYAPQGCYPCAGKDQWCAISVETDEQWAALCREMGVAPDPDRATHAQRRAGTRRHRRLDQRLDERGRSRQASWSVCKLRAFRPAACSAAATFCAIPNIDKDTFIGISTTRRWATSPMPGHQYRISSYDNGPRGPAPCLGQHSFEIMSGLLELGDEEIANAFANGAVN